MGGLLSNTTATATNMTSIATKLTSLATANPTYASQLNTLKSTITASSTDVTNKGTAANTSLLGMFSNDTASLTTGTQSASSYMGDVGLDDILKDSVQGAARIYSGVGVDKLTTDSSSVLTYVNGLSTINATSMNNLTTQINTLSSKSSTIMNAVYSGTSSVSSMISDSQTFIKALSFASSIRVSGDRAEEIFGPSYVKTCIEECSSLMGIARKNALLFEKNDMQGLSSALLNESGLQTSLSNAQSNLNSKVSVLMNA